MPTEYRFQATPEYPKWTHRKGGRRAEPLKGGKNAVLVPPHILKDGDTVDLDDFEASWVESNLPENFKRVTKRTRYPRKAVTHDHDSLQ